LAFKAPQPTALKIPAWGGGGGAAAGATAGGGILVTGTGIITEGNLFEELGCGS
jgi:hypothetical protein